MKNSYHLVIPIMLLGCPWVAKSQAILNTQVSGQILTEGDEPLAGATILVKGTYIGAGTNSTGEFIFSTAGTVFPLTLSVSYLGYETQQVTVLHRGDPVLVTLIPDRAATKQVIVAASREEENILRVPVTVEKVTQTQISQLTRPDLLNSLTQFKGIDVNVSSMLNNSISTRGFNSASSERLVQLVDYMDIQSPSLNAGSGNSLGLPDIDVSSVEVLYGPSSALYGANAFNGVVLLNSRDAFTDQGLDVRLRGGQRDYFDGQLRYAQRLGRRWAIKLTGSALTAKDWIAENYDAQQPSGLVPVNNPAGSGLGYDAVNRYGDIANTFTAGALAGKTVFTPGWTERELVADDDRAKLYRIIPSVSYLLTDKIKATVQFERAQGNNTVQSTVRLRAKDFATNQYRLALEGDRWFVRAYQTQDFGNHTYNLAYLGGFMQGAIDPTTGVTYAAGYFGRYAQAYNQAFYTNGGNDTQAQAAAQAAAAPAQLVAGSDAFNTLRQGLLADNTPGRGARLNPSSRLRDVSAQYHFRLPFADLIAGGAYRDYRLDPHLLFENNDGQGIRNYEYGGYAQLSKAILGERLKLAAAGRLDNFKNFSPAFSPRASAVYSLGSDKQHNFRASYSRAFRSPTQSDQYVNVDLGAAVSKGNAGAGYQGYSAALGGSLGSVFTSANPPAELAKYAVDVAPLRLEQANSFEVGYKALVGKNLVLDLSYYRSYYRDFVVSGQPIIGNVDGSRPTFGQLAVAAAGGFQNTQLPTRILVVSRNLDLLVRSQGALASVTYTATRALNLTGNYALNVLLNSGSEVPFYNTPKHKFNAGAYGTLSRKLGYRLNYHWAEGHRYYSTFADGTLATYQSLDAQVHYALPALNTTLELGGSNLLNTTNVQVYGGPQIGQLVYAGLRVSVK
ncbi:MAG: TonB-dependent receptor [Hymenobacter sp.]|nr:MAG: TonB-dependent receptor [Hymenobacter sp.]